MSNAMSTPIQNIPIKKENNTIINDINDPLVKDVINDMQTPSKVTFVDTPTIQYIQPEQTFQSFQNKELIDYEIIKLVIGLIVINFIVFHPYITDFIKTNISLQIIQENTIILKYILLMVSFYLFIFYYK
jgi:hypothetical protein